jgi:hypothetical protein
MTTTSPTPQTVQLHRALYMQQAIKEAAETFADFASFKIRRDGAYYAVDISDIDADTDGDVVAEFCNFALHHTIQRKKKRL